jgi:hypothetical protein
MGGVFISYPKGLKIKEMFMQELPNFDLTFTLPQTGEELHFVCDARRMVEIEGEIQVGAVMTEPDEASLKKLKSYIA